MTNAKLEVIIHKFGMEQYTRKVAANIFRKYLYSNI